MYAVWSFARTISHYMWLRVLRPTKCHHDFRVAIKRVLGPPWHVCIRISSLLSFIPPSFDFCRSGNLRSTYCARLFVSFVSFSYLRVHLKMANIAAAQAAVSRWLSGTFKFVGVFVWLYENNMQAACFAMVSDGAEIRRQAAATFICREKANASRK